MDKNELERRLEAAEKQNLGLLDEIKNLKAQLAKVQDEPEIPDKPDFEMDEKFYYLNSETDDVEDSCYDGDIDAIDFNMFHTEEYAHEFRRKCLLIAMILHCKWYVNRCYVPDWGSDSEKCYVTFDNCVNKFKVRTRYAEEGSDVYFGTIEAAQKCAEWLNEHWKEVHHDTN